MAEEPLKTLWLGAHATCTACPPHFNLSCQSLSAKQFIHSWGAGKKPFLCCLLGDTQDLFRSFLCLCANFSFWVSISCVQPLEAYKGLALKGGQYPLGYIRPYHLSTSLPIHHHGGHLPQQLYPCMCNRGLVPTQGYILTICHLEGCLWMLSL